MRCRGGGGGLGGGWSYAGAEDAGGRCNAGAEAEADEGWSDEGAEDAGGRCDAGAEAGAVEAEATAVEATEAAEMMMLW